MCMYCKNSTTFNSTTTHVVNYKNCIIVILNELYFLNYLFPLKAFYRNPKTNEYNSSHKSNRKQNVFDWQSKKCCFH